MVQRAVKFTPEVLLSAPRRSAGVPNASGTKILYTISTYSFQTHKKTTGLRVLDVQSGSSTELARDDELSDFNWLDEDQFVCLRAERDGKTSVCVASVDADSKEPSFGKSHYVAASVDAGLADLKIAPLFPGDEFAVVLSAQASKNGSLFTTEKAKRVTHSSGRLYDGLFARHWDRYETKEKNALWYGKLSREKEGKYTLSALHNALKDTGLESPIRPFGGIDNFDLRHDAIIFVAKDPDLNPALNVKCNVYMLFLDSWTQSHPLEARRIVIPGYEGASTSPCFEKNGSRASFLSMSKAGYESDRNSIFVIPVVEKKQELTAAMIDVTMGTSSQWDRSPGAIAWSIDGASLIVSAEDGGYGKLFSISGGAQDHTARPLTTSGYVSSFTPLTSGLIFVSGSSLVDNSTYFIVDPNNEPDELTTWNHSNSTNGEKFGLHSTQVSSIWTPASNPKINKEVQSMVMKPRDFDKTKQYPVAYLIHGGPQGSWADTWSTRWNPAIFAEQGYIVVAPNITGSTGYGQAFTDAIRKNWGGDPYEDIVKAFEWVSDNMPQADNGNAVALGASYGGYMMNWIQGHDLGRKFKALVCHDGIFSATGMLATEELYFPLYEFGGTPWYDPGFRGSDKNSVATQVVRDFSSSSSSAWRKWDPSEHLAVWATPQLIIHSEKDYRLPVSEGLAAFNVLQARGIDSSLLTYPDENHWVLKPENSLVWHKVVLNWINKYTGLPPVTDENPDEDEFWGGIKSNENELAADMPAQGKPET